MARRSDRKTEKPRRYRGVGLKHGKFVPTVRVDGRNVTLGAWDTPRDAAIARDRAVLHLGTGQVLELPRTSTKLGPASPAELRHESRMRQRPPGSNRYWGVTKIRAGRWHVAVFVPGEGPTFIGAFSSERTAAMVHDRVVRGLEGAQRAQRLNFPEQDLPPATIEEAKRWAREERRDRKKLAGHASDYWGVLWIPGMGKYRACVYVERQVVPLGHYDDPRKAALAHDRAAVHLGLDVALNLPVECEALGPASPAELRAEARVTRRLKSTRFAGVARDPRGPPGWVALVPVPGGRPVRIAKFAREEDAALAHDRVALGMYGAGARLNFPKRRIAPASVADMQRWARQLRERR